MKITFICFRLSEIMRIMVGVIFIVIICGGIQIKNLQKEEKGLQTKEVQTSTSSRTIETVEEAETTKNIVAQKETTCVSAKPIENKSEEQKEKTRIMPTEIKGFNIIGKIEIPKLKIDKYILKENNSKALKVSVAKLYGPEINEEGNFCIAGHNYNKIFGKVKNLEKNDQIILTDVYGNSVLYQIYDIYQTSPKDVSCLNQNTQGDKELTLITCTNGAIKRIIVKAVELYD